MTTIQALEALLSNKPLYERFVILAKSYKKSKSDVNKDALIKYLFNNLTKDQRLDFITMLLFDPEVKVFESWIDSLFNEKTETK